ncbi:uncharacterized protein LOC124090177 isoform X4 [Marmota monax]|uniref:uncharacterized protein LOC124090177 isoform X4 n=1 Tax=Marmota monax TaxID=9995 RepID=UPI0026F243EB|nr:uncharacterized protein LOC124090177 isoform X4 [Marmota monax]
MSQSSSVAKASTGSVPVGAPGPAGPGSDPPHAHPRMEIGISPTWAKTTSQDISGQCPACQQVNAQQERWTHSGVRNRGELPGDHWEIGFTEVWSNRSFLLSSMALTSASMLASSLATQLTSAVTMAEAGGAACGTLLAGLSSQGAMLVSQASLAPVASTVGSFLSGFSAVTSAAAPIGGATMISKAVLAPVASAVGPLLGALNVGSVAAAPIGVKAAAVVTGGAQSPVTDSVRPQDGPREQGVLPLDPPPCSSSPLQP